MTRRIHTAQLALILTTLTTAACATATPGLSVDAGARPPVGARLVPQPSITGDPSLKLDVSAYYVNEPGRIEAKLRIEPDPRSRSVTVEWWTDDGVGGSHLITLDGDQAARVFRYPITRMTEGEYRVAAILRRSDGTTVRRERRVLVIGQSNLTTPMASIADEILK
jgi:hypothetical protein